MRRALAVLVVVAACSRDNADAPKPGTVAPVAEPPPRDAAATAADLFAAVLARATGRTASGPTLQIGTHTLALVALLEESGERDGSIALGVRVECVLDQMDVPALTAGIVGVARTPEAALETAARQWATTFGVPLVAALERKPPSFEYAPYKVYASAVGIRDASFAPPADLAVTVFREIAPAVMQELVAGMDRYTVTLILKVRGERVLDGEARVDGRLSEPVGGIARRMRWSVAEGSDMVRLHYVITR